MWFAFDLWNSDICHSCPFLYPEWSFVVICFRSLKFWYLSQYQLKTYQLTSGCDLLSIFEILIFVTVLVLFAHLKILLWFAFDLWNSDICHSTDISQCRSHYVVICFRSLKFWYLSQSHFRYRWSCISCDLLSIFEILIFVTVY